MNGLLRHNCYTFIYVWAIDTLSKFSVNFFGKFFWLALFKEIQELLLSINISVPIAPGELIDKITILEIKLERISAQTKLVNIKKELDVLWGL